MKNAMQLKSIAKNIAKNKKISAQLVLQNYMLERFLERVSVSKYRDNFIIKGGFLISSIVGLDSRTTMDIDATIKHYPVSETTISDMIQEISKIPLLDGITFTFLSIGRIRKDAEYSGYRVHLSANFPPTAVPLTLDITTGDAITPHEIIYEYKLMLENRKIKVLAYNLETILSEKLESVFSRGDQNTRPRDFYDIYTLTKLRGDDINLENLSKALTATFEKRKSVSAIRHYKKTLETIKNSDVMKNHWNNYRRNFDYAKEIEFLDTCNSIETLMMKLEPFFN